MQGTYLGKLTRAGHDLVFQGGTKEGQWFWYRHEASGVLYFCAHYPGESHFRSIPVNQGESVGKLWGWDHALDFNQQTVWHGYVVAGNFRSV